ncbi:CLUMA_CG015451, isoform A [Clunio marinus]|uniref:CLUMA_CG015451, isoform A n=1 Tax=Clunio marinus TaxID=568069 RepID=A0A1J1IRZ4_9DIPT|nr:CLUMA_CG015451, isoform A [Clunio marinus]
MKLVCEFNYINWLAIGNKYTSTISSSSITEPNTIIQKIDGQHLNGKNDRDVEAIRFSDTTVNYFPNALNKIFPNLKSVEIYKCGLKSITRRDLIGLENVQRLSCGNNNISSLPDNLFRNMKKLIDISFRDNDLHCMSSELLMPTLINNIKLVDFRENQSIDAVYCDSSYMQILSEKKVDSLAQLVAIIDQKCDKPINDNCNRIKNIASEGFKELWATGRLSDITIVTDTEKLKLHKTVLAIQSSVFTSIFEDKMKDRPSDEIQMTNINSAVVKIFLKFLYTDEIEEKVEVSNLLELFSLAAKYKVENLMRIVEGMIIDDLYVDNAIEIFELACRYDCDKMKTSAFEFIQSIFVEPLKDELMNQPEVVKELIEAKRNFDSMMNKYKKN